MTKVRKGEASEILESNGERPFSARSVVASTLLGMKPPKLTTRILVGSGELFGISEGTTRVALSRMVSSGELKAINDGYELAGQLLERQERQDLSRQGATKTWQGDWRTEVVVTRTRSATERSALRAAAHAVRLAELREGVWLRPDNLLGPRPSQAESTIANQCMSLSSRPRNEPVQLAALLWKLSDWSAHAAALCERMSKAIEPLHDQNLDALPATFVLSASVLRHFQGDPLLPAELLPKNWCGASLRAEYEQFDQAFTGLWRAWYHAQ